MHSYNFIVTYHRYITIDTEQPLTDTNHAKRAIDSALGLSIGLSSGVSFDANAVIKRRLGADRVDIADALTRESVSLNNYELI